MNQNFYNFVLWLNCNHGKLTNREIINDYYNQLENVIKNNNLIQIKNFKNEFTAYIYEHSFSSTINKSINNIGNEPAPEIFYIKYETILLDFFDKIKEDVTFNSFNILDSNEKVQKINFIDLIERNIDIKDDKFEEDDEESEYSDYDSYY